MITAKRSSNIHEDTVLERNGMRNDGTFGVIDDLSVNYDGNKLLKVTDDAESLNYNGALDFNDGADMTAEYEYDSTGALTKDRNRGITGITYDLSHNPQTIVMNGGQIVNDYTSDGRKLCSTQSTGMTTTTDMYVDGLIIRNGAPLMWQFNGGYVSLGANSVPQSWNYYITDHLGSTRMVVDSRNIIKETINYYPYGSEMTMTPPAQLTSNPNWQPYRFTGKELVRQNGLNMYDFGARWYDVAGVPVWTSMDPLCEKNYPVTPYSYCNGDPVNAIDPDGKKIVDTNGRSMLYYDKKGNIQFTKYANSDARTLVKSLSLTKTGTTMLNQIIKSDINVHFQISDKTVRTDKTITYGTTLQGNMNKKDHYGKTDDGKSIKESTITIYRGSIQEGIKEGSGLKHEGLTEEQAIGAVIGHEAVHATNKKEISTDIQYELNGNINPNREKLPVKIEQKIIDEYKK